MTFAGSCVLRSRLIGSALALVLVVGLSACGSDGDEATDRGTTPQQETPTTGGTTDPCRFLTTAEVAAAGITATNPQPVETATGAKGCNYGDDPFKAVQVVVQPGGGQTYFDQSKDLLSAPKPLSRLGDEAVLDASNPQQVTVLVIQDDTVLMIGGSITSEAAEALAKKALGRLGG